jgi:pyrimidine operon attenuation protein/uracil phosphoribosyltransferase
MHRLESLNVTAPTDKLRQLLDAPGVVHCLDAMAAEIAQRWKDVPRLAVVGVYRRGVPFARQLANRLEAMGKQVDFGKIDITQYRDDLQTMKIVPQLEGSEIDFDMDDAVVILCDEVIYTARTTRAALDELLDFGRARCVQLAVLVDRCGRELPIHPDYTGIKVDLPPQERVSVRFAEHDGWDEVFVRDWEARNA